MHGARNKRHHPGLQVRRVTGPLHTTTHTLFAWKFKFHLSGIGEDSGQKGQASEVRSVSGLYQQVAWISLDGQSLTNQP